MNDSHLIGKMRQLKKEMLWVSDMLASRGTEQHAEEMQGAAEVLQTWIDGIRKEVIEKRGDCGN